MTKHLRLRLKEKVRIVEEDCLIKITNNDHSWNTYNQQYKIETSKDDFQLNSLEMFFDFSQLFIKLSFFYRLILI